MIQTTVLFEFKAKNFCITTIRTDTTPCFSLISSLANPLSLVFPVLLLNTEFSFAISPLIYFYILALVKLKAFYYHIIPCASSSSFYCRGWVLGVGIVRWC